jgi:hypothetical protein
MSIVYDVVFDSLRAIVFHGTGALLIRLLSLGRVRAERWLRTELGSDPRTAIFGARRDADGTLHVGAVYAEALGFVVWVAIVAVVIMSLVHI